MEVPLELAPYELYWEKIANIDFMRDDPEEMNHPLRIRMCHEAAKVGGKVLDVGCGTAIDYPRLIDLGLNYTGVEPIPKFIERARTIYPNITIHQARCWNLPFPDKSYDTVYCKGMIQHLPPGTHPEALDEMWRVTSKLLMVSTNRIFIKGPNVVSRAKGGAYNIHYDFKEFNQIVKRLPNSISKSISGFVKERELEKAKRRGLIHTLFLIFNKDYWKQRYV